MRILNINIVILIILPFIAAGCNRLSKDEARKLLKEKLGMMQAEKKDKAPKVAVNYNTDREIPNEAGTNPFLTAAEIAHFGKILRKPLPLNVTAIIYTPSRKNVVIDGAIYTEGDKVNGKEITKIEPNKILLKDKWREYVASLKDLMRLTEKDNNNTKKTQVEKKEKDNIPGVPGIPKNIPVMPN